MLALSLTMTPHIANGIKDVSVFLCSLDHLKRPLCVQMARRSLLVSFLLAYTATSRSADIAGEASTTLRWVAGLC